jgi:tetratricopeptide (TPR) repeat protein
VEFAVKAVNSTFYLKSKKSCLFSLQTQTWFMFQYFSGIRADALRKRGQKLLVKSEYRKAEKCFRKALDIADNIENRFNLALTLLSRMQLAEAEKLFVQIAGEYPENEINLLVLFETYILQEKWQSARQQIAKLHEKFPESRQFRDLHEMAGDVTRREKYRQVKLLSHAATELARQKNFTEALAEFQQALQFMPDNAELLNNTGSVLMEMGEYQKAFACYEKALAQEPANQTVQRNLARAKSKLRK